MTGLERVRLLHHHGAAILQMDPCKFVLLSRRRIQALQHRRLVYDCGFFGNLGPTNTMAKRILASEDACRQIFIPKDHTVSQHKGEAKRNVSAPHHLPSCYYDFRSLDRLPWSINRLLVLVLTAITLKSVRGTTEDIGRTHGQ